MCDEIIAIEEIIGLQTTYSILDLELSTLISNIIYTCKQHRFNILDLEVFFHSLRDIPFTDENLALKLYGELEKCTKEKAYSHFKKKIKKLRSLIKGKYIIEGSLTMYSDNKIRWDTRVSFMIDDSIFTLYANSL
ncbi:MAG: hypothetical protein ACFFC3_13925 [Candidatus Odinarchaeota archaeon]